MKTRFVQKEILHNTVIIILAFLLINPIFSYSQTTINDIPGLDFTKTAISYTKEVTDTFTLHSMKIVPDSITLKWDVSDSTFSIYGSAKLIFKGNDELLISLGDKSNAGMKFVNDNLEEVNFGVTTDFTLKGLEISPKNLTFFWDKTSDKYEIYGDIVISLEADTIGCSLGDIDNPGIEILQGKLDKIEIGITEDFKIKSLTVKTIDLGLSWQKESTGNVYHLFGSAEIDIEDDVVEFSFGDMANPGLVYSNGKIDSFQISTNDDLHFGGMEVKTEDLTLKHHNNEYHIYGKILLKEMWEAEIDLGTNPDSSGVTLDFVNGKTKFKIEQASFDLGNIDLGAITLKNLKIAMANNKIDAAGLLVEFPPGWEVGGDLTIDNGSLNSLDIDWTAENIEEAIEMPGTGSLITHMKGGVYNLDDPHIFYFDGEIGFCVGGFFEIDGKKVTLIYLSADVKIDRNELSITSDIELGAYMDNDGEWHSVLGDGNLDIDFKWGRTYSLSGKFNVPSSPNSIISANLDAHLSSSGAFNALVDVGLKLPHSIPLIGGRSFGSVDGAVYYDKNDPKSFAAGWVKVDLVFDTIKKGVKYNFKTKQYSIIGSKGIHEAKKVASVDRSNPSPIFVEQRKFVVERENPPIYLEIMIKLKPTSCTNDVDIYVQTPGDQYIYFNNVVSLNETTDYSDNNYCFIEPGFVGVDSLMNSDEAILYIMPVNNPEPLAGPTLQLGNPSPPNVPPGTYWIHVENSCSADIIDTVVTSRIYAHPTYDFSITHSIGAASSTNILKGISIGYTLHTHVHFLGGGSITYYVSSDSTKGRVVGRETIDNHYQTFNPNYNISSDLLYGSELYTWAVIEDNVNPPVKTEVKKISLNYPIYGNIVIEKKLWLVEGLVPASGIEVTLWANYPDSSTNNNRWQPISDITNRTDSSGNFSWMIKVNYDTKLEVDIPWGYEVLPNSPYKPGDIVTFDERGDGGWNVGTIILRKKD